MAEHIDTDTSPRRIVPTAGIHSPSQSMLESFLDEFGDAPAYELTYTSDGTEHTDLVYDLDLTDVKFPHPHGRVTCHPLPPGTESFTTTVEKIDELHTRDPSRDRFETETSRPADRARGLRRLAQSNPESVAIPQVLALLDRDAQSPGQDDIVSAIRILAEARPVDCTAALPLLDSLLGDGNLDDAAEALQAVAALGTHDPADIVPLTDAITPYLTDEDDVTCRDATRCIAIIAEHDPDLVVDIIPTLASILDAGGKRGEWAAYATSQITQESPESVTGISDVLRSVVVDDDYDSGLRVSATAALGRVADTDPSLAVDIVDDITTLLDADSAKLRNNAIALLGEIAQLHADALTPYTDDVEVFLSSDDEFARVNASWVLATVATDFPEAVADATPELRDCLDDEEAQVRANACYAVGRLGETSVIDQLERLAGQDPDERVRRAAGISHDQLTR